MAGERAKRFKKLSIFIPVVMLPLGVWLGYRTFHDRSVAEVCAAVAAIPQLHLLAACGCVVASYLCLTGFDTLAVRYVGHPVPYRKIALTSFVSLSIGHTVGVSALSSGTLRYRFYSGFGLSAVDVGTIVLFCGVTVGLGLMCLAGVAMLWRPDLGLGLLGLSPVLARGVGILCFALAGLYVLLAWRSKKAFTIRGHTFRLPPVHLAAGQIAIGTLNFTFVATALHQLLAGAATYSQAITAYVLANVSGLVSHVPGGIGVLEYVISSLIKDGNVIGALIAFRILYFLVPLALGITLLVAAEAVRWRRK